MTKFDAAVLSLVLSLFALGGCGKKTVSKPKPAVNEEETSKSACPAGEAVGSFKPKNANGDTLEEQYPLASVRGMLKVLSGGQAFVTKEGRLLTLSGDIDDKNPWFAKYSANADTLFGRRPQNIFRVYVDTCLLSSKTGFYMEVGAIATDYRPPDQAAYLGGVDLIAQWWSPQNPNEAFLCKEQYGGFCGNVGYHTKIKSDGDFEISRERPEADKDPSRRYESLSRLPKALYVQDNQFPLNRPMRLRMEVVEKDNAISITSCFDDNADGVWDKAATVRDDKRAITGYFVPIFRSDWMSAEFFEPHIGALNDGQKPCSVM